MAHNLTEWPNRATILDTPEDLAWLYEVHFREPVVDYMPECAVIYGNEDAPTRIELFRVNNVNCDPAIFVPSSYTGNWLRV